MKRIIEKIIPVVGTLSLLGVISNFLLAIWVDEDFFVKTGFTCCVVFGVCLFVDKYFNEKDQ